jgi:hypothetical protein
MSLTEIPNGFRYSAPDEQRTYQPPAPPPQFEAPQVIASAAKAEGTVLEQAHAAIVHARNEFAKHIEKTNTDRLQAERIGQHLYTDDGYREQLTRFKDTTAGKAVPNAVEQVRARCEQHAAAIDAIRRNISQPGDAAQESRNSRTWARNRPLLEQAAQKGNLLFAAEELMGKATREELGVLAEELPAFFAAHGVTTTVTNQKTGEKKDLIDEALARVVPEYAQAKQQLIKARQGLSMIETSAQFLQRSFDNGSLPPSETVINKLNPSTAGRLPIDRHGTLPDTNAGRYDPDKV